MDADGQTEAAAKLCRPHCARHLASRTVVGLLCFAPLRRIVHCVHYGVRVQTADLDPELDLGCLPYRERFASRARDEVHFEVVHRPAKKQKTPRYSKKRRKEVHKKAKKQKGPERPMSEGPAGELSAEPAPKRIRRDRDRISLLQWLNRRLDVVNVPLGMKVGDLADRLAATWPLAGDATGGVLKIYFRTHPAESLAYLCDRVKLDELTALRLRDGVPKPDPAAAPAPAEAATDALVAHDTSRRKRHLADAPVDSPADGCSEAAPMGHATRTRLPPGCARPRGH